MVAGGRVHTFIILKVIIGLQGLSSTFSDLKPFERQQASRLRHFDALPTARSHLQNLPLSLPFSFSSFLPLLSLFSDFQRDWREKVLVKLRTAVVKQKFH